MSEHATSSQTDLPRDARAARRLRSRQQLLQVAIARIAERGLAALSVQDVAATAGMTTGAVYHQFRDRDDLVRAASSYALESSPTLAGVAREVGSLEEFLVDAARTALELVDDTSAGYRDLVRVHLQMLLGAAHDDVAQATISAFMADQLAELTAHVAELADLHGVPLRDGPEAVARDYLALLRGFLVVRMADPDLAPVATVLAAVEVLLRGHKTRLEVTGRRRRQPAGGNTRESKRRVAGEE